MIISIASGKGGTGKTTIAINLALALATQDREIQFLDCDVEEPNAGLFLKPQIYRFQPVGIPIPVINEEKCTYCGKCSEVCAYNAIAVLKNKVLIFEELCHGCGGCTLLCPEGAITEKNKTIGTLEEGRAGNISFIDGRLNPGEAIPTPLVREVKKNVNPNGIVIIDASPGTSCPVIEAVKGSDYCILVTEPTPFGLNDLILAVEMVRKLGVPMGVVINRSDIGDNRVEDYCRREGIPILMRIPMDRDIMVAYSEGIPIVEKRPEYRERFKELFKRIDEKHL